MDSKKLWAWSFILGFTIYAVWLALNFNKLAAMMQTSSFLQAIGIYLLSQPSYLLIIYLMYRAFNGNNHLKVLLASFLILWCFDIVSFPRLANDPSVLTSTVSTVVTNSDTIILKELISVTHMDYSIMWYIYYWVLPIVLLLGALYLLGYLEFRNQILNKP